MIRAFIILPAATTVACATRVEDRTLEQLVADSDHIVVGKVESVKMYGWFGIPYSNPAARTGPGSSNELRWKVSVQPPGVLYSLKNSFPQEFAIRLWRKWHMSLEGARHHEGQTYILLLKGDDLQWVYPASFYRDLSELAEIQRLIQKKPNQSLVPTTMSVTSDASASAAPATVAAHF